VLEFDSAANRLSIGSDALLLASDCKLAGGKPREEALDLPIARRAGAASARESISGRTFGSCTSTVEIACVLATKRARRICNDTFQARLHGRRWFFNYAAVQHEQDAENCESERGVNVLFHYLFFLPKFIFAVPKLYADWNQKRFAELWTNKEAAARTKKFPEIKFPRRLVEFRFGRSS